jgi:hypothetical protein
MSVSWWTGLAPAEATIACGEHEHRLRWERGALRALAHDDPEAERALAALGGERCACVDVLDAWQRHEDNPRVLVLASRGPADPLAADAGWTAQLGSPPPVATITAPPRASTMALLRGPARRRATTAAPRVRHVAATNGLLLRTPAESDLVALLGLGGGLPDRLAATVAAAWADRFDRADVTLPQSRAALHASMHGRLAAAARAWLGRADVPVELELIEDRRLPTLTERKGAIRAELPFAWLSEVWSRGLAIVWGRLCLAAATEDGRAWKLIVVGPDLGPHQRMLIELAQ